MALDASALAAEGAVAAVATPAGEWRLGWNPTLATYWAAHRRGGLSARADHEVGAGVGACPTVSALQEALGFALPAGVRSALAAEWERRPPLAHPRSALVPDRDRPRGVDTYPQWSSAVEVFADGGTVRYGLAMEQERPVAVAELGEETRLEVLAAEDDPASGRQRVEYRLTHEGRVVFAGADVYGLAGADIAADESLRAVLAMVLDPDAPHRTRLVSPAQSAFVEGHAARLLAAAAPPAHPYPEGTRVAAWVDGRRWTGVVVYPATHQAKDTVVTDAYAWRPDVFSLTGHPCRRQPDHVLTSAPEALAPTLAPPFTGAPDAGVPLAFGATVATADPDTGARLEATVVRAFVAEGGGFTYQVQPRVAGAARDFIVSEEDCAAVQGAWWPGQRDLIDARKAAGVEVVAGEVFAAGDPERALSVVGAAEPPGLSAAQRRAALVADEPAPTMLTIRSEGPLTIVGDTHHGWLLVDTASWSAAMTQRPEELMRLVGASAPAGTLTGAEPRPTLAALAALHAHDDLGPAPLKLVERLAALPMAEQPGVGV